MVKPGLTFSLVTVILLAAGSVTFSAEIPQPQVAQDESLNPPVNVDGQRNDPPPPGAANFHDCAHLFPLLYWTNTVQDGVFPIKPESSTDHFDVYCDMTTDGGGWTVIQRRLDGRLNFDRLWADYKTGFGRVEGEHWLGLDKIHTLTSQNSYELYVELQDWEGNFAHAKYNTFSIGDESTDYTLNIGGYSGDAGDSMYDHNGRKFSARDVDNDSDISRHCAQWLSGGWWYNRCAYAALNSPYFQPEDYHGSKTGYGVLWYHWKASADLTENKFAAAIKVVQPAQVQHYCTCRSGQETDPSMTSSIKPKTGPTFSLVTVMLLAAGGVTFSAEIPQPQVAQDESLNHPVNVDGQRNDPPPPGAANFQDCSELYTLLYWINAVHDGVFPIKPESSTDHFDVYCDMTTDGGGWTVIQRRVDGRLNFDRNWPDYKTGFGRVEGEHWLGLDKIHALTSQNSYELYVELQDWEGNFAHAKYGTFSIGDESTDYTLHIGGYSGDAGDAMGAHNGKKFSARDRDNDDRSSVHCARWFSGGWWYVSCGNSALNAAYFQPEDYHGSATGFGVLWYHWKGSYYPLKATKMMVRPQNFNRTLY
ncbi:negative regulation of lipoprotein lipase [Branchiostoma belcheri]|nr:negative regulation of lipoprotein lipase [Branchiostoma belcheri]